MSELVHLLCQVADITIDKPAGIEISYLLPSRLCQGIEINPAVDRPFPIRIALVDGWVDKPNEEIGLLISGTVVGRCDTVSVMENKSLGVVSALVVGDSG